MERNESLPVEIVLDLLEGKKDALNKVLCHYYSLLTTKAYCIMRDAGEEHDLEGLKDVVNGVLQELSEALIQDFPRFYEGYVELQ